MRIFLPLLALLPAACGPPAPPVRVNTSPGAVAVIPLDPAAIVWRNRPRAWDRLLIGLTHLPPRPILTAKPVGTGRLIDISTGRLLAHVRANAPVMLFPAAGQTIHFVTPGAAGTAIALHLVAERGDLRLEGRSYTGSLFCWQANNAVTCALDTSIESYLAGVVPGEVPASWPLEAQKALAVAARTYALASRGKHAAEGFDLCDGTHCQMFLGHVGAASRSKQAVRLTRGLVALYAGRPIRAFYSADCGGQTANNEDVPFPDNPPEPLPYLRSVADAPWSGGPHYCARGPSQHWMRWLTAEQIESALNADPETAVGTLRQLQVTAVDGSGRVKTVRVEGVLGPSDDRTSERSGAGLGTSRVVRPVASTTMNIPPPGSPIVPMPGASPLSNRDQPISRSMAGYAFRRAVGPRRLKSTRFTLTQVSPSLYRVTGSGNGHGVGLCQIGARGMALPPFRCSFRQILKHYYRGITIARFRPAAAAP